MERDWFESDVFRAEPYCKRMAWEWLISHATWEDTKTNINGRASKLERGQLSYSNRYLSEAWKWPKTTVVRFLKLLEKRTMVHLNTGPGQTVITICNYDKYQSTEELSGPRSDQQEDRDRSTTGPNIKKGRREEKKEEDKVVPFPGSLPPKIETPLSAEQEAFEAYNVVAEDLGLSKARTLTAGRKKKLGARLEESGGLEAWREALGNLRTSEFCLGDNDRGWKANIDFLLQPDSFTRLLEGAYSHDPPAKQTTADQTREAYERLMSHDSELRDNPEQHP